MLQGLWQHCSTMPRFTIMSIWSLNANSASSLSPPAAAVPPAFGGRKPGSKDQQNYDPIWIFTRRIGPRIDGGVRGRPHPSGGRRLSWGCRRSLGPRRPGKGRRPGGSRTGAVEARRPASRATMPPVRPAGRRTGATELPCCRRADTHVFRRRCVLNLVVGCFVEELFSLRASAFSLTHLGNLTLTKLARAQLALHPFLDAHEEKTVP